MERERRKWKEKGKNGKGKWKEKIEREWRNGKGKTEGKMELERQNGKGKWNGKGKGRGDEETTRGGFRPPDEPDSVSFPGTFPAAPGPAAPSRGGGVCVPARGAAGPGQHRRERLWLSPAVPGAAGRAGPLSQALLNTRRNKNKIRSFPRVGPASPPWAARCPVPAGFRAAPPAEGRAVWGAAAGQQVPALLVGGGGGHDTRGMVLSAGTRLRGD